MKKLLLLLILVLIASISYSQTIIVQDSVSYKVENGVLKGWMGQSPFEKPIVDNGVIIEGWTAQDQTIKDSILNQRQLDIDVSAIKTLNYITDGQIANKRIWDRIMREFDSGNITEAQFNTISNALFDAILPLEFGRWKIAKSRVDATTDPSNSNLLAIKQKVQQIIDNYIAENY